MLSKRLFLAAVGVCVLIAAVLFFDLPTANAETKAERDQRMQWWREARFGMFIHWGLYSVPAGQWKGKKINEKCAEWIQQYAQIPVEDYEPLAKQFNPVKFDADQWVRVAKDAGVKYIVITTKHHEGFCLFDSKYTDYDVMSTPFKRDIMKELADACRRQGIQICWYHSIMDWHHPDYLPRRPWEKRSAEGANFDRYVTHLKNQLRELMSNYGKIGVLWFDGEWENTWTHRHGQDLDNYVHGLDPNIIVNNRVDKGREVMAGLTKEGEFSGDFGTPEQKIPATGLPGVDWETCMTMNDTWGYATHDQNWKSKEDLIRKLIDIVSKGGNFLLNVGPTAEGVIPPASVDRLEAIGQWMKTNGESIYGTSASPFEKLAWGRCTQKQLPDGKRRLYLHVFDWPKDGKLVVPSLGAKVTSAYLLADPNRTSLTTAASPSGIEVALPAQAPDAVASVVVLEIAVK
jgi:alpha-L-fucosidase